MNKVRNISTMIIIALFALLIAGRLFQLQLVDGAKYAEQAVNRTRTTMTIKATRGEILDRYGRPLVTNRMGYSLIVQKKGMTTANFNVLLDKIKTLLTKNGDEYIAEMPDMTYTSTFTFATDISLDTIVQIEEQKDEYPGVVITSEPIRSYVDGTLAAHLLGRVGIIYAEEYAELKSKGYSMTAMIGKDGIEKYLEEELSGEDGVQTITSSGVEVIKEAIDGEDGILTIDVDLQKILEKSLGNNIIAMRSKKDAAGASSGAAVAIDVNSGEILAMASYPTFDLSTFNKNYESLLNNKNRPMFNRAIGGAYEPGSTFKILTAIAGLEEGVIKIDETITDEGVYRAYEKYGYTPACWIWTDSRGNHGMVNVQKAIQVSCNYYFYEVGKRLGIDKLNEYAKKFGLGQKTNVEASGEVSGILAGPQYRKSIGAEWYVGDTLQAAIGQSDNLFTPLQIANYIATVANGGTLYRPHLVKAIGDRQINPEVLQKTNINKANLQAILNGMDAASEVGTASGTFANYKVKVGSKTGTASVSVGEANAVFVAVAPLDKPEIAIAIVIEHGGHGAYAAPIAKDVFDKYFSNASNSDPLEGVNVLL